MGKEKSEHMEQCEVMEWARRKVWDKSCPELDLLFAIPNGGHRNKLTGARLKAEGVKAGVSDLFLSVARWGLHGLYIEMKQESKGKLSPAQQTWRDLVQEQGYGFVCCHGAAEAIEALSVYLGIEPKNGGYR